MNGNKQMSFATHRMRPPEPKAQVTENDSVISSGKMNFFSNSGLIDYNSGFNVFGASSGPPKGPSVSEITSIKFEPIETAPQKTAACSAEDSAREIARQITGTLSKTEDSDEILMQSEFRRLSTKKPVSFEKWIASDVNRKMMMQSGAESALRSQYTNLRKNFGPSKSTQTGRSIVSTEATKPKWTCNQDESIESRLSAVEEQVGHMSVGLEDHTYHLKMMKEGMTNHTTSLKKVIDGMHNHTAALKVLSKPDTGLDSASLYTKYAANSARGAGKRVSNEDMAKQFR